MGGALQRWKPASMAMSAIVATIALVLGVLVVRSESEHTLTQHLGDGAVWLASTQIGGVSLVDSATGASATELVVASANDELDVVQAGTDAIIVNLTEGAVSRLDAATWSIPTGRIGFAQAGQPLSFEVAGDDGWIISDGLVRSVSLSDLSVTKSYSLRDQVIGSAVDAAGDLFLSGPRPDSPVLRIRKGSETTEIVKGIQGPVVLGRSGGGVAALDTERRALWHSQRGELCRELPFPANEVLHFAGSENLAVAVSDSGRFIAWNPTTNGCPDAGSIVLLPPGRFSTPALSDGWGVFADNATSTLYIFSQDGDDLRRVSLPDIAEGSELALLEESGTIWYNDRDSAAAGVVRSDGSVTSVDKYVPGTNGFAIAPIEDSEILAPQVAGAVLEADEPTTTTTALATTTQPTAETPTTEEEQVVPVSATSTTLPPATTAPTPGPSTTASSPTAPPTTAQPSVTTSPTSSQPPTTAEPPSPASPTPEPTSTTSTTPVTTQPPTTQPPTTGVGVQVEINASAQQVTEGESIRFAARTVSGQPVTYAWVAPSATVRSASSQTTDISFSAPGTYTIQVRACDQGGDCDVQRVSVTVVADAVAIPVVAAISGTTTAEVGETVRLSGAAQGEPTSWSWDTDGGSPPSSSATSISVSWSTPGTKTIRLTVADAGGSHTDTHRVVVSSPVVAKPNPAPFAISCSPTTLEAGDNAFCQLSGTPSAFSDFRWSATNGGSTSSLTTANTNVTSSSPGPVAVTLTATDNGTNETVSTSMTITFEAPAPVTPAPVISGPSSAEAGEDVAFSVGGSAMSGASISWSASGGGTISAPSSTSTSIRWTSAGTYTVTVSANGVTDTHSIVITAPPVVHVHSQPQVSVLSKTETSFTVRSSLDDGDCAVVSWTISGGAGSAQGTKCLTYHQMNTERAATLQPGTTYTFSMRFTFADGHTTDASIDVTTNSPPPVDVVQLVITGASVNPATATLTLTTNICSTADGHWAVIRTEEGGVSNQTSCLTTHTFSVPNPVSGTPYRFRHRFTSGENGTTVDHVIDFTYP